MDPLLLLALDEIGNLSPLPSLPVLMAEGGDITTMPVLQSLSQARGKWGDHAAGAIWDASIVKIILSGISSAKDLQDRSALIGERDERTKQNSEETANTLGVSTRHARLLASSVAVTRIARGLVDRGSADRYLRSQRRGRTRP